MSSVQLESKARRLLELHEGPRILLLANAWDAASARIIEQLGFPAVATTSAGIANTLGYPDGQRIPREGMLEAVRRITKAVSVPVTADVEAGYGGSPEEAARTAQLVLESGAVGINLEDSSHGGKEPLVPVSLHVEKVRAIRSATEVAGIPMVINARTDVFLLQVGTPAERLGLALSRANAYREAGADCIFVPGVADLATIAGLVQGIHGPINILAGPATPPVGELEKIGVRRVSLGSGPMRAAMGAFRRIAQELMDSGTYECLQQTLISYADMNQMFAAKAGKEWR
ncbi:MAG TPA: isocitrate lyase/phosphoenolpyruvate mutase family protein [Terriglobia bacterium]|nr:isocitrate lyase/phosphoenolpyruvate mutase family protein [Terriglobia bacterium]